ncbi:MAG: hypothetical protein ACMUIU_15165 [bacterium]
MVVQEKVALAIGLKMLDSVISSRSTSFVVRGHLKLNPSTTNCLPPGIAVFDKTWPIKWIFDGNIE